MALFKLHVDDGLEEYLKTRSYTPDKSYILVVDNDLFMQISYALLLEQAHYDFNIAETAKEALEMFASAYFDLVLIDVNLPDMSGIEVCKTIRNFEQGKYIPIVACTALTDKVHQDCAAVGVNLLLEKPASKEKLLNTFEQALFEHRCDLALSC